MIVIYLIKDFSAFLDNNFFRGLTALGTNGLDFVHNVEAIYAFVIGMEFVRTQAR